MFKGMMNRMMGRPSAGSAPAGGIGSRMGRMSAVGMGGLGVAAPPAKGLAGKFGQIAGRATPPPMAPQMAPPAMQPPAPNVESMPPAMPSQAPSAQPWEGQMAPPMELPSLPPIKPAGMTAPMPSAMPPSPDDAIDAEAMDFQRRPGRRMFR